jgi:iron(III) transport system permease protein
MRTGSIKTSDIIFYAVIAGFLGVFLLYPAGGVIVKTFYFNNQFTPQLFLATLVSPVVSQSAANSLLLGVITLVFSTCIALPLAIFVSTYEFKFKTLISGLVLIPMIMPPFVGAIGIERIFARYGTLNMLLGFGGKDWISQGGLAGVALLQALHLFPMIYLNLTAALSNIDPQLIEAARISGADKRRIFTDITIPLMTPGYFSGAILVFLWSLTDLGTPLVLGFRNLLAVEVFDRITSINNDPTGPAMVVLLMLFTIGIMAVAKRLFIRESFYAAAKGFRSRELHNPPPLLFAVFCVFTGIVLILSLLPHIGLILTSVAGDWFMTALPSRFTMEYFGTAVSTDGVAISVRNSALYASASTLIDVVLGFTIAWFVLRRRIRAGWLVDAVVMLPLALPGLVLAFGYVAAFSGTFLDPLKNPVPLLIAGYAVRRLPYMFRAVYAGLSQSAPEFEEASRVCGAGPVKTAFSITAPLIFASIIAGSILTFMFAVLEVSESLVLAVKKEFFPVTRQIYAMLGMIPDGDYAASALGVLCMLFLAAGIAAASAIMGKQLGKMFRI